MASFDYESIDPGYYHKAMLHGKKSQRFWHQEKFRQAARLVPQQKITVLDVGCGPGSFFYVLRRQNRNAMLIGTDLVPKQVQYAKTVVPGASWFVADATMLPLRKDSVDVATSLEVVEHLPKSIERKMLAQIHKALRKDGKLIITTPNYRSLWPLIEWVWNKMSPVNYQHQHINKKTIPVIVRELRAQGFSVRTVKTFFIISPFVAAVFPSLGRWLLRVEQALFPRLGSVILIEATR